MYYPMILAVIITGVIFFGMHLFFFVQKEFGGTYKDAKWPAILFFTILAINWAIACLGIQAPAKEVKPVIAYEYLSPGAVVPRYFRAEEFTLLKQLLEEEQGVYTPLYK